MFIKNGSTFTFSYDIEGDKVYTSNNVKVNFTEGSGIQLDDVRVEYDGSTVGAYDSNTNEYTIGTLQKSQIMDMEADITIIF